MTSQEGFPTPLEIKVLAEGKYDKVLLLLDRHEHDGSYLVSRLPWPPPLT